MCDSVKDSIEWLEEDLSEIENRYDFPQYILKYENKQVKTIVSSALANFKKLYDYNKYCRVPKWLIRKSEPIIVKLYAFIAGFEYQVSEIPTSEYISTKDGMF
jgi:hypothetical protein